MMQVDQIKSVKNTAQPINEQAINEQASPAAEQTNAAADSVSKDIQSKIIDAQKQRQGLSFNMEMTAEEKENIRQKIQQEISDLKRELRQKEAEEKQKQQEAQRAVEKKQEQQEREAQEAAKKQQLKPVSIQDEIGQEQKVQTAQNENEQQNTTVSENGSQTDISSSDGEVREILPGGLHKVISTDSSVKQFQIVKSAAAQNEKAARIQETEMNQDAVRRAETGDLKKDQLKAEQKETQRMETVQQFIFGNSSNRSADTAIGAGTNFSKNAKENGLYDSSGAMFQNYIQSIQMDIRQ